MQPGQYIRAVVRAGATGAIAPVDFEKGLIAPVDFRGVTMYVFKNFFIAPIDYIHQDKPIGTLEYMV